ncbi:hypothetical protein B0F90DRAFT_1695502 [Multifurca ochricompacta]|uniref:NTF2 domain-containing protein n=1 Tax=Multifurca ochricompacta TaxID=376703 RepID=A0AAD4M912_9AGAM|nr:hypothetical protein B0F90DRAFT_1695502 [Multifurca ochricompacta]
MFRPWYPPTQNNSISYRPSQHYATARSHSRSENEQLNKSLNLNNRHHLHPPVVNSVINTPPLLRVDFSEPTESIRRAPDPAMRLEHSTSAPSMSTSRSTTPKRRKLGNSPPTTDIKRRFPIGSMNSTFTSTLSVSPVKREPSLSPELPAEPQPTTSGSRRYAPLPQECEKSHPNYKTARNVWARREEEALKRLGLTVVRTFIREDGMVIDWEVTGIEPTDAGAVIERASLLNDVATRNLPIQPVEKTWSSPAIISRDSNQAQADRKSSVPSRFEVAPPIDSSRRASVGDSGPVVSTGYISDGFRDPGQKGQSHRQRVAKHANPGASNPTPVPRLAEDVTRDDVPIVHKLSWHPVALQLPASPTPDHLASFMYPQTTSIAPQCSTPISNQAWRLSSGPQGPRLSSQQRNSSLQSSQPLPSPSQRALDALQHILELKRQIGRRPSHLPQLFASSSSPSPSLQKSIPTLKAPQNNSPSERPAVSSADAVAAAINESARLGRVGSESLSEPSMPLRVYKRRTSPAASLVRKKDSTPALPSEAGRSARGTLSPGRISTPSITILAPTGMSPRSQKGELASSSYMGNEYDELELSYPPSPPPPPPDSIPHHLPLGLADTAGRPSFNLVPPTPEENSVMRSKALRYLERYCQTFDMDRRALAGAYTPDATFSCCPHNLHARGRDGILETLQALGCGLLFSGNRVEYDVTYLGPALGVLLVVFGIKSDARYNTQVGYTMSFVLRPVREDQDSTVMGLWPLVAIVHQMILREGF